MNMLKYIIASILSFSSVCNSHIFMNTPPSRHNLYSEYYVSNNLVNYNLRSPLNVDPDFFTFPCKGFAMGPPTYSFYNNNITMTLEGTAIHGGGHCQFGITYDNINFVVLKTVLNTCLLDGLSFSFNLPDTAPDGSLTIFWTWINRIGNREYYMECADVNVISNNINSGKVDGKELFIANLPNYPYIPEWNPTDSPDNTGETLLLQVNDKVLFKNNNNNIAQIPTPSQIPVPPPISISIPAKITTTYQTPSQMPVPSQISIYIPSQNTTTHCR